MYWNPTGPSPLYQQDDLLDRPRVMGVDRSVHSFRGGDEQFCLTESIYWLFLDISLPPEIGIFLFTVTS